MPGTTSTSLDALVLVDDTNGITVIPQLSELRRLNWFDGKLLRADDLRVEQDHMRGLVRRANRAGGRGVVEGFTVTLGTGGPLHVGPGMAIDPSGRSLLLPVDVTLDIGDLIAKTAGTTASPKATGKRSVIAGVPPKLGTTMTAITGSIAHVASTLDATKTIATGAPTKNVPAPATGTTPEAGFVDCVQPQGAGQAQIGGGQWYVISVGWAEGLCGNEEIFGGLCEAACTTSTDRPWRMDGLVFRARAITPHTALIVSSAVALDGRHERSLVASALFADEYDDDASLIFGAGLRSGVWCSGAAAATSTHDEVPLAVIGRAGSTTRFLDMWSTRRERMEAPPRRYWAGRTSMRPWDVFLAQVLQFQCQLADVLDGTPAPSGPGGFDPCAERQTLLEAALHELKQRPPSGVALEVDQVLKSLEDQMLALKTKTAANSTKRVLLNGGIVELPPAGYLPVSPAGPPTVQEQVRALIGEGVDLTFCTTRHDAVAHLFERAQHLERISLLTGLDDPKRRQAVEIVVPDADLVQDAGRDGWEGRAQILVGGTRTSARAAGRVDPGLPLLDGAGRVETAGALALRWAGASSAGVAASSADQTATSAFAEASIDSDPFSLVVGHAVSFSATGDIALDDPDPGVARASVYGNFLLQRPTGHPANGTLLHGVLTAVATSRSIGSDGLVKKSHTFNVDRVPATLLRSRTDDGDTQLLLQANLEGWATTVTLTYHGDADTVALVGYVTGDASAQPKAQVDSPLAFAPAQDAVAPGIGVEVARLTLSRKPSVASPQSPPRIAAEGALRTIEAALNEPGYAHDAGRRLFPADDGSLRLRATRDWVLFRRRAVLHCGGVVEAPVEIDSFAVYAYLPDPLVVAAPPPRFLGELRFVRGSAEVAGGLDAVLGAWSEAVHGLPLETASVVSGSPGGDDLGLERAATLVQALAAVTEPSSSPDPQLLQHESVSLDARGADGIIVVGATGSTAPRAPERSQL